jgi:hypothetical protein
MHTDLWHATEEREMADSLTASGDLTEGNAYFASSRRWLDLAQAASVMYDYNISHN